MLERSIIGPNEACSETEVRLNEIPEGIATAGLVVIHGPELGRRYELSDRDAARVTLGREPRCTIPLPVDDISRRHLRLDLREGFFFLTDLESTNGTYLNDRRLPPGQEVPLRSGDHVRLGSVILKFLQGNVIESLYHEEIYRLAIFDGLTQLHNRRYLLEFLEREMARAQRHQRALSLLVADIDHFKGLNDRYGHLAGDDVLREVSVLLRKGMRRESCLARLGGEEFAIALPETRVDEALVYAEKLRGLVEIRRFRVNDEQTSVTLSVGAAELAPHHRMPAAFLDAADAKLYDAKSAGRNCVRG